MRLPRANGLWMLATVAACVLARPATAQSPEYAVKAAYLFNFINFTEWPAEAFAGPAAPLRVCVLGLDPFGRVLEDTVRGEAVRGHALQVRRVSVADDVLECHVLFVPASFTAPAPVMKGIAGSPVLTIGESDAFWDAGGVLRFVTEGTKVRFDANARAAQRAGLRLSARLMQVARSRT